MPSVATDSDRDPPRGFPFMHGTSKPFGPNTTGHQNPLDESFRAVTCMIGPTGLRPDATCLVRVRVCQQRHRPPSSSQHWWVRAACPPNRKNFEDGLYQAKGLRFWVSGLGIEFKVLRFGVLEVCEDTCQRADRVMGVGLHEPPCLDSTHRRNGSSSFARAGG